MYPTLTSLSSKEIEHNVSSLPSFAAPNNRSNFDFATDLFLELRRRTACHFIKEKKDTNTRRRPPPPPPPPTHTHHHQGTLYTTTEHDLRDSWLQHYTINEIFSKDLNCVCFFYVLHPRSVHKCLAHCTRCTVLLCTELKRLGDNSATVFPCSHLSAQNFVFSPLPTKVVTTASKRA
jgi:hypothetical protein